METGRNPCPDWHNGFSIESLDLRDELTKVAMPRVLFFNAKTQRRKGAKSVHLISAYPILLVSGSFLFASLRLCAFALCFSSFSLDR